MRNIFKINIFTYIFLLLYFLSGFYKDILIIYLILFIHELGHYIIMRFYNIDVQSITFYPYGGMIKSNMLINTKSIKVLIISLGGIISQIILLCLFFILYKLNVVGLNIFDMFSKYNSYIILFNLLPMYPLDGFKIFSSLFELFFSFKCSVIISFVLSLLCIIIFIIYLYVYNISNYVIVIFLLVSLINYIKEFRYLLNKFYVERILYNLEYNGLVSVNSLECIYKNKFNYINGVNEREVLRERFNVE